MCRVNVVFIQNTKVKKDSEECKLRIHTISATNITMLCWCMKLGSRLLGYITVKSWLPIIFTIFLTYTASTSKTSAKTKFPLLTFPSINNNAVGRHFIKHQLSACYKNFDGLYYGIGQSDHQGLEKLTSLI